MSERTVAILRTIFRRFLLLTLCVSVTVSTLTVTAKAETTSGNNTPSYESETVDVFRKDDDYEICDDNISFEIESRREEHTKHFRLKNGNDVAVSYQHAVFYYDEHDNKYVEIDNSLGEKEGRLQNSNNDMFSVFFSKDPEEELLSIEDKTENVRLSYSLKDISKTVKYEYEEEKEKSILSSKAVSGKVRYTDVYENTDVEYQIIGNGMIKENIILRSKESPNSFLYQITVENGYLEEKDGKILIYVDDEAIYQISAPYACDRNGNHTDKLGFSKKEENIYELVIDQQWLNEADYPVVIDPLITSLSYNSSFDNMTVISSRPDSNELYGQGMMYAGKDGVSYQKCRGAFIFDLPEITEADMVVSAKVSFVISASNLSSGIPVLFGQIEDDLPLSSLTWNTLNGNIGYYSDYAIIGNGSNLYSFDVTSIVRDWYLNGNNYGIAVVSDTEETDNSYVSLYTTNNTLQSSWPYVTVQYVSSEGIEDDLTYHSYDSTLMGSITVGDFNGNLIYSFEDHQGTGNYLPVSISHVYNHAQRSNEETVSSSMKFGKGFRLSVLQQVRYDTVNDWYTLTDSDGTTHYYLNDGNDVYINEEDDEDVLHIGSTSYYLEYDNIEIIFDKTSGLLTRINDKSNGKYQLYTYLNNQLRSIRDGAERLIFLNYDEDNYLTDITYNNQSVEYSYDEDGHLVSVTTPYGETVQFTYSDDLLVRVKNTHEGKYEIEYSDNGPKRVTEITKYGSSNGLWNSYTYEYGRNDTTITDNAGYSVTYLFDNKGHTICVKDSDDRAVYGSYNSDNTLRFESDVQMPSINLLKNHYPTDNTAWTSSLSLNYSNNTFVLQNGERITQSVSGIDSDTYTFSCYVKAISSSASVDIGINNEDNTYTVSDNEYKRISFVLYDNESTSLNCYIEASGNITVKNFVLERGAGSTRYSLVENGSFKNSTSYWTGNNLSNNDGISNNGYLINGSVSAAKGISQTINIAGYENDSFVLNGWAMVESTVLEALNSQLNNGNERERNAGIRVTFNGNDTSESEVFNFESVSQQWQYLSAGISAPIDYTSVTISLICEYIKGSVLFDKITLYKENFGTSYQYDNQGRVIRQQDSSGNIIITAYKDITVTNEDNTQETIDVVDYEEYILVGNDHSKIVYSYDSVGNVITEILYDLNISETVPQKTVTYEYDEDGNLISSYINGTKILKSAEIDYDEGNYVNSYTDQLGTTSYFNTDPNTGKVLSITTGTQVTNYSYDSNDQITEISSGDHSVKYSYNNVGMISSISHNVIEEEEEGNSLNEETLGSGDDPNIIIDPITPGPFPPIVLDENITKYSYTYDQYQNVSIIHLGSGIVKGYQYYDDTHQLKSVTKEGTNKEGYQYDSYGRVITVAHNNIVKYRWDYGNNGSVSRFRNDDLNLEIRYEYDVNGNLIEENRSDNTHLFSDRNSSGLITANGYTKGNNSSSTSYFYNYKKQLDEEVFSTNNNSLTKQYTYDEHDRVTEEEYTINNLSKLQVEKEYLTVGQNYTTNLLSTYSNSYGNDEETYQYSYDSYGNISQIVHTINQQSYTTTYQYDDLNQLIRENDQENNRTIVYEYDLGGNITKAKRYAYTTSAVPTGMISKDTYGYAYDTDWSDQLTSFNYRVFTYDTCGNLVSNNHKIMVDGISYSWSFGNLSEVTHGNNEYDYAYNHEGIRVSKTVNNNTTNYVISGHTILQETRQNGDTLIYEYDAENRLCGFLYNNVRYIYLKDGQDNITGIIDTSGNKVSSYSYDAWGKTTVTNYGNSTIGDINPFRYRSYYYDVETGYYYLNARYYDPAMRRFISADSVETVLSGNALFSGNLYTYCNNNPVIYIDKDGQSAGTLPSLDAYSALASLCGVLKGMFGLAIPLAGKITLALIMVVSVNVIVNVVNKAYKKVKAYLWAANNVKNIVYKALKNPSRRHKNEKYCVYAITEKGSKNVVYIGRTNNYTRRMAEHQNRFPEKDYDCYLLKDKLSFEESQALEQILIAVYTLPELKNAINAIAKKRYLQFIEAFYHAARLLASLFDGEK